MRTDTKTDPARHPRHRPLGGAQAHRLEFKDDNLTDWAAALTYYAVLALFPALLALVALLGIFGQYPQTTNALIDVARQVSGGNSALDGCRTPIDGVVQNKGGAGALLGLGLAGALWSASGYIGAFMRASNAIYEVEEGRPFWKLRPLQVVVTLVHGAARRAACSSRSWSPARWPRRGPVIGLGSAARHRLEDRQVAVMAAVVLVMLAVLYYAAPNARLPRIQWLSPGAVVGAGDLGRRLRGLRLLRRELRLLQQDLRHARRRDLAARVVVDLEPRGALRPGAQRRDRARARAHRRAARRARPSARAARRAQGSRGQGRRGLARRPLPPRGRGRGAAHARG